MTDQTDLLDLESVVDPAQAGAARSWLDSLVRELAGAGTTVGVAFCDDGEMARANERYRRREGPTDVLSFPSDDDGLDTSADDGGRSIGDILVSVDTARRQASEAGETLAWELQCLLLHGVLHCLGHDHETDGGEMDAVELELRERWVDADHPWALPTGVEPAPSASAAEEAGTAAEGRKFGRVALVGRPNAGKSTLMNRWLGEKLSIVSDKPQTTRHRMVGLLSNERGQMVFLDTPGIHKPQHRLNRRMVKAASDALAEADVVCLLVDASVPNGRGDEFVRDLVARTPVPKLVLLNKIDVMRKGRLLPLIASYAEAGFDPVVPISALEGDGADEVLELLWQALPEGEPEFDTDLLTIQTERFLVAERIREKVLERTREELPFVIAVVIEAWEERGEGALYIAASLLVEKPGQKKILIGRGGQTIRDVGTAARHDLEAFLGRKVFLDLVVREERGWREDARTVARLEGYEIA